LEILTDHDLRDELAAGRLFRRNSWVDSHIKHASYELRLGREYEVHRRDDKLTSSQDAIVKEAHNGYVEIEPWDTAVLFTLEDFLMSPDFLALVMPRGVLFRHALVPATTYVDPGFHGRLRLYVTNTTSRTIRLPVGMQIARAFFFTSEGPLKKTSRRVRLSRLNSSFSSQSSCRSLAHRNAHLQMTSSSHQLFGPTPWAYTSTRGSCGISSAAPN
jgi:deoxycytidine triphosphate deaminase